MQLFNTTAFDFLVFQLQLLLINARYPFGNCYVIHNVRFYTWLNSTELASVDTLQHHLSWSDPHI